MFKELSEIADKEPENYTLNRKHTLGITYDNYGMNDALKAILIH